MQSEEFFRTLYKSDSGVPLKDINNVSLPSSTLLQSIQAILRNRTSRYYVGAVLCGITAALISSLAPAALSVGLVLADGNVEAIEVGAVGIDSAYRFGSSLEGVVTNQLFRDKAGEAASTGWVQNVLGAEIQFMPTSSRYGVPVPLNIDPTDHARYLTDVVIMDPICNWTVPTDPLVAYDGYYDKPQMTFKLPEFGILVQMFHSTLALQGNKRKALYVAGYYELSNHILNSTTLDPDTSGSMAWIISQCTSCTESNEDTGFDDNTDQSKLDLSELPTAVYSFGVNGTNTSYTVQYSILVCNPRILIETREVVLDGTGRIEVLESTGLTAQGNLHLLQTHLLVGNGLAGYSTESGPETSFNDVGRAGQVKMFFGPILDDPTPTLVLKPQPVERITNEFTLAQQGALRTYLSGVFGTSYVPGRVQITKLVFTSSLPHIIVSTILFAAVTLFVIICHLRPSMKQFTLYSIATVMARSNAGAVFEDAKYAGCTQGDGLSEEMAIKLIEDRRVYLTNSGGPGPSLYIE